MIKTIRGEIQMTYVITYEKQNQAKYNNTGYVFIFNRYVHKYL